MSYLLHLLYNYTNSEIMRLLVQIFFILALLTRQLYVFEYLCLLSLYFCYCIVVLFVEAHEYLLLFSVVVCMSMNSVIGIVVHLCQSKHPCFEYYRWSVGSRETNEFIAIVDIYTAG